MRLCILFFLSGVISFLRDQQSTTKLVSDETEEGSEQDDDETENGDGVPHGRGD
jgi:hypothetical protein